MSLLKVGLFFITSLKRDNSMNYYFVIYIDSAYEYRWRLVSPNNQIIAVSGEGYTSKQSALIAVETIKRVASMAYTVDETV